MEIKGRRNHVNSHDMKTGKKRVFYIHVFLVKELGNRYARIN
jgi:hypothetical protein